MESSTQNPVQIEGEKLKLKAKDISSREVEIYLEDGSESVLLNTLQKQTEKSKSGKYKWKNLDTDEIFDDENLALASILQNVSEMIKIKIDSVIQEKEKELELRESQGE